MIWFRLSFDQMADVSLRFKRATAGGTAAHFMGLGEMNLPCPGTNSNHEIATRGDEKKNARRRKPTTTMPWGVIFDLRK